jgi:hypothetical protein
MSKVTFTALKLPTGVWKLEVRVKAFRPCMSILAKIGSINRQPALIINIDIMTIYTVGTISAEEMTRCDPLLRY